MPRLCELPTPEFSALVAGLILLTADCCAFIGVWGYQGPAVRQGLNCLDLGAGLSPTCLEAACGAGCNRALGGWEWAGLRGGLSPCFSVSVWNSEDSKNPEFKPGLPCY